MLKSGVALLLETVKFENLAPGGLAGGETDRRLRNPMKIGEHRDDRGVRLPVHRRRVHPDMQLFATLLRLRNAGAGVDSNPNFHDRS